MKTMDEMILYQKAGNSKRTFPVEVALNSLKSCSDFSRSKVHAIKALKALTGMGLKESKAVIDEEYSKALHEHWFENK